MKDGKTLNTGRVIFILINYLAGYNFLYPMLIETLTGYPLGSPTVRPFEIGIYVFVFITTLVLGWPLLKKGWHQFVTEFPRNRKIIFLSMAALYGFTIFATLVVYQLSGMSGSRNQTEIQYMFRRTPFFIAVIACIFAPVVEEIVFRGCIVGKLKEKNMAALGIIISSVLFGLLHVLSSLLAGDYIDLLNIIVYSGMGMVFSIIYYKTDSIVASMMVHLLNNAISVLIL